MSENRFISRKAIAEAFSGFLLFFYFIVKIFVATFGRRNHFKSAFCSLVHAVSTEVRAWRHFTLEVQRGLCSFA